MTTDTYAPLHIRRDADIYETDGGWFHARWHFSFDQYRDPQNMNVGYLRVFNHDTLRPGAVWPMHPHRDVEGITYVVAGEFEHADSLGNGGVLLPGGVQRMTLGSGANHSERNHSQTDEMQFVQMWILPNTRGLAPSVEQHQFTTDDRTDRLLRILKPEGADGEGIMVHQDASMYVSRLTAGKSVAHEFTDGRGGYVYLIDGAATFNEQPFGKGDAAKVLGAGQFAVTATADSELLIADTPLV
jgi:redox-sensitive bicupin YhaK (pirin superfamily)